MSVYSSVGRFIRNFGSFYRPTTAEHLRDGTLMVNDHSPRTSICSADGRLVGSARSMSTVIHGMSQGPDGCIYDVPMTPSVLTRLRPVARL